jgi:hypothetical protein
MTLFDPTINYSHVLTVSSFLIAAASAYYGSYKQEPD